MAALSRRDTLVRVFMRPTKFESIYVIAFSCAVILFATGTASARSSCEAVSREIVNFSRGHKISQISVLEFTAKDGADPGEADYISEKFVACLAGQERPALIERAQLASVLKESRLSAAGAAGGGLEKLDTMFSVDAVITGAVFPAGKKLKILVRLIEVKSGKVLLAAQAEEKRERARPSWGAGKPRPDDLMDKMILLRMAKVKTSDISFPSGKDKAGDGAAAPQLQENFSNLLNAYYKFKNTPPPGPEELPAFMEYLESSATRAGRKRLP